MTIMNNAAIVQNCYVVNDLEDACLRMHELYGIGPFLGGSPALLTEHSYRGEPADPIEFRAVFAQSGDLNIELVQVLSNGPDAFHDMFPGGGEGLHHVAVFADDYTAERDAWVDAGYEIASEFTSSLAGRICYIDARKVLGHMVELYPPSEPLRAVYRKVRNAAADWDGKELIISRR